MTNHFHHLDCHIPNEIVRAQLIHRYDTTEHADWHVRILSIKTVLLEPWRDSVVI